MNADSGIPGRHLRRRSQLTSVHVGTTTADTPSQLDTDLKTQGGHEWRSVDISNYAEVEAATAGTDLSVSEASSLAFPCSGRAAASEAESDVPILCIITIRTCVGSLSCLSQRRRCVWAGGAVGCPHPSQGFVRRQRDGGLQCLQGGNRPRPYSSRQHRPVVRHTTDPVPVSCPAHSHRAPVFTMVSREPLALP